MSNEFRNLENNPSGERSGAGTTSSSMALFKCQEAALVGESFEAAEKALSRLEVLTKYQEDIKNFEKSQGTNFSHLYKIFLDVSLAKREVAMRFDDPNIRADVLQNTIWKQLQTRLPLSQHYSSSVAALYRSICLYATGHEDVIGQDDMIEEGDQNKSTGQRLANSIFEDLKSKDESGVSDLDVLFADPLLLATQDDKSLYERMLLKPQSYEPDKIEELDRKIMADGLASKFNRLQKSLSTRLRTLQSIDKMNGEDIPVPPKEEEAQKDPSKNKSNPGGTKKQPKPKSKEGNDQKPKPTPPPRSDRTKPGMDKMDKLKEGEKADAIWEISPPYNSRYFREQSFSHWDVESNEWVEEAGRLTWRDPISVPLCGNGDSSTDKPFDLTLSVAIDKLDWVSIPCPYKYGYSIAVCENTNKNLEVKEDQYGELKFRILNFDPEESCVVNIHLAPLESPKSLGPFIESQNIDPNVSDALRDWVEKSIRGASGTLEVARRIKSICLMLLKYSDDESLNETYNSYPDGYFAAIEKYKKADCDVANTFFAGLCSMVGVSIKHVIGHSVKGAQDGVSAITSGTGHAWSEVWCDITKTWIRIDATPSDDPSLKEKEEDKQSGENENIPSDNGDDEGSSAGATTDSLKELEKKLKEHKERLSYDQYERDLSAGAKISLEDARSIMKEIRGAESLRLPDGRLVKEVLEGFFRAIVDIRRKPVRELVGPVTLEQNGRKIMPRMLVTHAIQSYIGNPDPMTRERSEVTPKETKNFSGFDLFMIGDLSGSMAGGGSKIQQKVLYLITAALANFNNEIKAYVNDPNFKLEARSRVVAFNGGTNLVDVKPLDALFTPVDKVNFWKNLGEPGGGNGDVQALAQIFNEIKNDIETNNQINKGGSKKSSQRLRLVVICSDGGVSGGVEVNLKDLSQQLGDLGVFVVGVGLGDGAKNIPLIYNNPPISGGDLVLDINDLPGVVLKHFLHAVAELFPDRVDMANIRAKLAQSFSSAGIHDMAEYKEAYELAIKEIEGDESL